MDEKPKRKNDEIRVTRRYAWLRCLAMIALMMCIVSGIGVQAMLNLMTVDTPVNILGY